MKKIKGLETWFMILLFFALVSSGTAIVGAFQWITHLRIIYSQDFIDAAVGSVAKAYKLISWTGYYNKIMLIGIFVFLMDIIAFLILLWRKRKK